MQPPGPDNPKNKNYIQREEQNVNKCSGIETNCEDWKNYNEAMGRFYLAGLVVHDSVFNASQTELNNKDVKFNFSLQFLLLP